MRKIFLLFSVTSLFAISSLKAQTYPETDSLGNSVYYKVVNANPAYSDLCLEDNNKYAGTTGYKVILNKTANGVTTQEWQLIADATSGSTAYYFRNRSTRRYISSVGEWRNNYYAQSSASTKTSLSPFIFQSLDSGQVAIKFSSGGEERYVFAADSAGITPILDKYSMVNSSWAWKIYNANNIAVSINEIINNNNVKVDVVDRRIVVTGAKRYAIYTDEGVRMNNDAELMPGIYFVNTGGVSYKVLVK